MPRLPPGTVFDIIDHLADDLDVGTLSTCSLVSLSWMTHSRAHAFSKVMIANTTRLRTFLDLLHGGGHSFRFCVQELNVGSRASGVRTDLKRSDLVILLGNLPTLVSLLLANIVWDDDLGGKCMKHIPYYTPLRLTLLKLVNFTVRDKALSMVQLSSVIHLFSGINYLALLWDSDVEFSTDNAVSHACAKTVALPQLGELSLLNSSLNPRIIKWLCNGGIGSSFKALTVYVADESTLAALGQLLRSSGQLLETLSLYLHHDKGLQNIKREC
ncbi:uncharacterized protein PHACADRAFT_260973 [Phanerochaete carnosa HHB-10118-sp]|uniref:F-box domain-containing protein n=1 Tax=Phanerochaete carnosa (strain HHB-10118-sp) TaxID=650164 RepID=K5WQ89_PHACS|nr:uncharacterized protein PHACADRAFT_260973 [Phanerochaete carnosa HHB-10118-sp]EKM52512.1 hypothetical protein PHACADRAFT_260973 [Phanerochaete carnosa HHB-10118-sp]